jgi:hypothetical protein
MELPLLSLVLCSTNHVLYSRYTSDTAPRERTYINIWLLLMCFVPVRLVPTTQKLHPDADSY